MNEFMTSFLANIASDALLAIAIYFIITQPSKKKGDKKRQVQILGLIKNESIVNRKRATTYSALLSNPKAIDHAKFPMAYTRSVWNTVRETGFVAELREPKLAYLLFRMNELCFIANKNLRRFELAHLEDTGGDIPLLAQLARKNCDDLAQVIDRLLEEMSNVEAIDIGFADLPATDLNTNSEDRRLDVSQNSP